MDTNYHDTFNRDNVSVVDIRKSPIDAITPQGVQTGDAMYAVDGLAATAVLDHQIDPA